MKQNIIILINRSTIKTLQKKLISANYISKGGSLNATSGDEFVSIIFEEKNFEGTFDDRSGDLAECIVPHQMHVEVMYTRSSKRSSDQFSIYRVCGARVKWSYSRWSWMCRGQKSCGSVQRFPISMFVEHFEVPVNWHYQNTSRSVGISEFLWLLNFLNFFSILVIILRLGVSICLDVVSIETLDLDTEKKSVSTAEKISSVSKS
jgi:hypothetical protein